MIVKEQFINLCHKEFALHLRERAPETLEEMEKIADQYLEVHGEHVFSLARNKPPTLPEKEDMKKSQSDTSPLCVTGVLVEDISLLAVRPGNVIYALDKIIRQEAANSAYQDQEDRSSMVTQCGEIRLVLDV